MKNKITSRKSVMPAVILFFCCCGCGDDLVSELKDFSANTPPLIISFEDDMPPEQEILPSMQVNLSVGISDRDNDPVTYTFSSDCGTFRRITPTAGGCTVEFFISSTCNTTESIPVTVIAADGRTGSASRTIDLGDGRELPVVTSDWSGRTISSGGTYSFTFSADCSGYYQLRAADADTTSVKFNPSMPCFLYTRNTVISMTIAASSGINDADTFYLSPAGTYRVFIIVYDNFKREGVVSGVFTVN